MRILLFLHSFGPGGVERVALRLAGAWANAGQDVTIFMGRRDGPDRSVAPRNVHYDFAPTHPLARPFETLWMIWHLVGAVRRHRPDVIFCAGNTYTIVAALVRLILRSECPPIVCKLSNSLDRRDLPVVARLGYLFWLRQHRRFIDRFVGLSNPMAEEIGRYLLVPPERVAIIPNPVLSEKDLQNLATASRSNSGEGRRFVAVGRLTRQKNYRMLLRAFARFATGDDRLLIIGDGPQRRRLARLAARLGIAGQVEMPGHLGSVAEALECADVFVSSSNYEGLPGAIVEALAAGLPVVAARSSPCVAHLLGDGQLGQLVPIRDVAALSEALQNAPAREDAQVGEMRSMAAQFTVERSSELYLAVFAEAATARTGIHWIELQPLQEAA